jgi:hypothetical protein
MSRRRGDRRRSRWSSGGGEKRSTSARRDDHRVPRRGLASRPANGAPPPSRGTTPPGEGRSWRPSRTALRCVNGGAGPMRSEKGSSRRGPTGTLRSGSMSSRPEGVPSAPLTDRPPTRTQRPRRRTPPAATNAPEVGVPDPDDGSASPPPSGLVLRKPAMGAEGLPPPSQTVDAGARLSALVASTSARRALRTQVIGASLPARDLGSLAARKGGGGGGRRGSDSHHVLTSAPPPPRRPGYAPPPFRLTPRRGREERRVRRALGRARSTPASCARRPSKGRGLRLRDLRPW